MQVTVTGTVTETEVQNHLTTFGCSEPPESRESTAVAKAPAAKKVVASPEQREQASRTWANYTNAYQRRYGAEPVRNAMVNKQVSDLVKRLGAEAPEVAAFYLTHSGGYYVAQMHSVSALLRDCEKLRTEWITGQRMTNTKASPHSDFSTRDYTAGIAADGSF
jgi:hypothetical protein